MTVVERSYTPREFYPRLALLAFGLFLVGTNAFVIAGLLPSIANTLGTRPVDVSFSITWYAIIVAVSAPAISVLLPRVPRHLLMVAGLVLLGAGTAVAAASTSLAMFSVGRGIAGLGGAALVPAATAAAAAIAPPHMRGRAIAFVSIGFTFATALGSPLGTALGAVAGWQAPMYGVAGLSILLAVAVLFALRGIPLPPVMPFLSRFAPLKDRRVLATLATTTLTIAGFNTVYFLSSTVTETATGGAGGLLAVLLFSYGIGGVIGNFAGGQFTDRLGARSTATVFLAAQVVLLIAMSVLSHSLIAMAIIFATWGFANFASPTAVQHRLVTIDPATAGIALSWYTTVMYIGIGLAPVFGSLALHAGGSTFVPIVAAVETLAALIAFQFAYRRRSLEANALAG